MDFSDLDHYSSNTYRSRYTVTSPLLPICTSPCCNNKSDNSYQCAGVLFGLLFTVGYNAIALGGMIGMIESERSEEIRSSAWPSVGVLLLIANSCAGNWLLIGGCSRGVQDPSLLFVPALAINVS